MDDKKEEKKVKSVGSLTFGTLLILLGGVFILSMFLGLDFLINTFILWPAFLIILGIEVIYYSCIKNVEIKFNFGNVVLTGLVLLFAFGVCIAGCGIKLVTDDFLLNKKFKEELYEEFNIDYEEYEKEMNRVE